MNNSYLSHLDAMLVDTIWETIQKSKDEPEKVVAHLKKIQQLSDANLSLREKLRSSIQWALENIKFNEEQVKDLSKRLDELGGSIEKKLPTAQSDDQISGVSSIVPATYIKQNEIIQPNWHRVYDTELEEFLEQITPVDGKYQTSASTTIVDWTTLSFYQAAALIRVHDPMWLNSKLVIYYLTDKGNLFRLNGTSPPIHKVNAEVPITLNEENVLDYLKFFCFFVRGDEGPFYVLESLDDPLISDIDHAISRSIIERTVHPAKFDGLNSDGSFLCQSLVFYSNALFEVSFRIEPTGVVHMISDEPVAGDLEYRINAPIA